MSDNERRSAFPPVAGYQGLTKLEWVTTQLAAALLSFQTFSDPREAARRARIAAMEVLKEEDVGSDPSAQ